MKEDAPYIAARRRREEGVGYGPVCGRVRGRALVGRDLFVVFFMIVEMIGLVGRPLISAGC